MAELKTRATEASVVDFLNAVPDPARRQDCSILLQLMGRVTGCEPRLWGSGIVGFGSYHYRYATGREGDWFLTGFSPRKHDLTVYVNSGLDRHEALLGRLGKVRTGKSCLYLNRLADVDLGALEELVAASVRHVREAYATDTDTGAG